MPAPLTPEATEEINAMLRNARIGEAFWGRKLDEFGQVGSLLRDFVRDMKAHPETGLILCGTNQRRMQAFPVFARACVLAKFGTRMVAMRTLVDMLVNDSPYLETMTRIDCLFIDGFQTNDKAECPYSWSERSRVELYLSERISERQRVFLNSGKRLPAADWWTADFRALLAPAVTTVEYAA